MNILILSWRDPKHPLSGGAEQVTHEHAKGWIKAGHKVWLFSSRFRHSKKEEVLDNVNIIRGGNQYLGVQLAACIYYLKNRFKFSMVFDQFHGLPFFTPLYVKTNKIANVYETANKVWFLNHLPWPINIIVGTLGYILEPIIFLFYKNVQFVVVSESTKNEVEKMGILSENIKIVPAGLISMERGYPFKKEATHTISYLGALSKDKGIEEALRCFSILNMIGGYRFWIIGKPQSKNYTQFIRRSVKKLGLFRNVKFWGYVSQKQKFSLLSKSHLLVNPSVREGWGLVNIEANSVGTPVIAYNSPGLVDSVKDGVNGIICKNNTPLELANNVLRVLHNLQQYRKLQKGALVWSKKFTWKKSRKMSLKLIERVVKESP